MYFDYSQYKHFDPAQCKQKGNILIFLLIGIVVLAVAGGAFYLGRQTTPKPSPTPKAQVFNTDLLLELHESNKIFKSPVDTFKKGQKIKVKLLNQDNKSYVYNPYYQACGLIYIDSSGKKFIIPPGTHCDMISYTEIKTHETVTLFEWNLDECVQDNWGCAKSQPLPAGNYTIQGKFYTQDPIKSLATKNNIPFTSIEKTIKIDE